MDVAGRLLGVFKELPLWLFAALSAVIAAAWLYEPLQVGLPTMARASLPLLIVFFVIMTLWPRAGACHRAASGHQDR